MSTQPIHLATPEQLRLIVALANRTPGWEGQYEETWGDGTPKDHPCLSLNWDGDDLSMGFTDVWDVEQNAPWTSASLLRLIRSAGFSTTFFSLSDGFAAQACSEDGDGDLDTIASFQGRTECEAVLGLALWVEEQTRGKQ